jgi:signal transduction histidine kinase
MTPLRPPRRSSLFRRIYGTFVITFLIAAVVVGTGTWLAARALSSEWVADAIDRLDAANEALLADLDDPAALARTLEEMDRELGTRSGIYDVEGDKIAGDGPPHVPARAHRREKQLRRGRPVIHPGPGDRPLVLFPVSSEAGETIAIVHVVDAPATRAGIIGTIAPLLIAGFGIGAWRLSRSLTSRIGRLEDGVGRIAHGELDHRIAVPARPADEIDELGAAVNDMAGRLERVVAGQRTLLANVSHELRTPIARVKVLLEILHERLERIADDGAQAKAATLERLRVGIGEMAEDIVEMETLITDLLTSGRLELRAGEGAQLDLAPVDLAAVLSRSATKFRATIEAAPGVGVRGDVFLLERLFSNLLANARRACPDGGVWVRVEQDGAFVVARVEDDGPGIPAEQREAVFEPFRRLDDARSRDRGGVGLGLYLCRQICAAHDGTLVAEARPDGHRGASMCVRLPAAAS